MGVYLHIPFCRTKCPYCDFFSIVAEEPLISEYIDALASEVALRRGSLPGPFKSVYVGGGTPSILSSDVIASLLNTVENTFPISEDAEVTVEMNPADVNSQLAQGLEAGGVNRISLGIQSFIDKNLGTLGRRHDADAARTAFDILRDVSFDNIGLDLIFGIPGQSMAEWEGELEEALALDPDHISCYTLTIEKETPMELMIGKGVLPGVDGDLQADMFKVAHDCLGAAGFEHYEISNYAKPGMRSQHNMTYWRNDRYLGFGAVAFSYVDELRSGNIASVPQYISSVREGKLPIDPSVTDVIDPFSEMGETVIQSLRTSDGLSAKSFLDRFGIEPTALFEKALDQADELGLVELDADAAKPTLRGMMFWNDLAELFLSPAGNSKGGST